MKGGVSRVQISAKKLGRISWRLVAVSGRSGFGSHHVVLVFHRHLLHTRENILRLV